MRISSRQQPEIHDHFSFKRFEIFFHPVDGRLCLRGNGSRGGLPRRERSCVRARYGEHKSNAHSTRVHNKGYYMGSLRQKLRGGGRGRQRDVRAGVCRRFSSPVFTKKKIIEFGFEY